MIYLNSIQRSKLITQADSESFICTQLSGQSFKLQKGTQTFRVSIGLNLSCNCHLEHEHCVHTLYILMKVFEVNINSDILWQDNYDQKTLQEIYKNKLDVIVYSIKNILKFNDQQQSLKQNMTQFKQRAPQHDIKYDVNCSICQQDLKLLPTYFCSKQCGTNFHAECLLEWTFGKFKITCPICRKQWDQSVVKELKQISEQIIRNKMCTQCKIKQIKGPIYKCATCVDTYMCEQCQKKEIFHRLNHQVYLKKLKSADPWVLTTYNTQLIFQHLSNIKEKSNQIMSYSRQSQKTKKNLCSYCDNLASKQLKCGHLIDQNCISKLVENEFKCPIDKCEIFNVESQMVQLCNTPNNQSKQFKKQN